jgi:hypothetical protein
LTRRLVVLFARRKRDGYIAGGADYLGGDLYNDLVVDYRPAATWRARGWDSSGLSQVERIHAIRPGSKKALRRPWSRMATVGGIRGLSVG